MKAGAAAAGTGARPALPPRLLAGRTVGVVGLGQIGGSLIRRLSAHRRTIGLLGFDLRSDIAPAVGRYAAWCGSVGDLVERADIVVLAVPIQAYRRLLPAIARAAAPKRRRSRLIVCDTSTVKSPAIAAAAPYRDAFDFVALHPLAGRERNGWEASDGTLFEGSSWIVCSGSPRARSLGRELVRLAGGTPVAMSARAHDRIIAETIGLPHALAFASAGSAGAARACRALQGNSWGSLTRVAVSDPAMVAGFLHANAANQIRVLMAFRRELERVERALGSASSRPIARLLERWRRQSGRTNSPA